ncbi:12486_t:CDS:2 [Funneliformis caledonium]|uniref:Sugar phosphate phosphatase n=1 Tax=Funneliformis caledonium TaxID=1117310 RepID=A0A9N8VTU4_9GLOM|nr:12486_t:CDS:2 [Funneliformis caledonium]
MTSQTSIVTPANPPRSALRATDEKSFAFTTTTVRWPVIITKIIDDVYKTRHELDPSIESEKMKEGIDIMDSIALLKYEIQRKKPLKPIDDDGEPDVNTWIEVFNKYFKEENWHSAPWLFTECYLYRRTHSIFVRTKHWRNYDPFFRQKEDTFKASFVAIIELAKRIDGLISNPSVQDSDKRILFHELAQISLWGNATDLSLLTNLSHDDIKKLQGNAKSLEESEKNILVNDLEKVWGKLSHYQQKRIDFVLDNTGFELYGDLIFADWLIQNGYASEVHLHVKAIPWFVSDTTPSDFNWLLGVLKNDFFSSASSNEKLYLERLAKRWQGYVDNGKWILKSDYFWTSPYAYWHLKEQAPELFSDISKSSLVIFKGDLNYRKLVYDCKWPTTTLFKDAIGPLATEKGAPPILALRTSKADVIVGLPEGIEERLSASEADWMFSGKYAVVQFSEGNQLN